MKNWVAQADVADPVGTLETILENLAVNLIATERKSLVTCAADESITTVVERNQVDRFDYMPVTQSDVGRAASPTKIIGLLELVPFIDGMNKPHGLVRERMHSLSEENLIGADASILAFVRDADRQKCRLVVSGREISGLVSLSDLQRLPVRAVLFAMVTHLEIVMAYSIRRELSDSTDWLGRLSPGRQKKLKEHAKDSRSDDSFVDMLLFTQFSDKIDIIKKSPNFLFGRKKFEKELKNVEKLRNKLAHANDYAASRDAASCVCETVRVMDDWIHRLSSWQRQPLAKD